jgi:hypothetical protein
MMDELVIVRLAGAHVSAYAEWEIVVVNDADMFVIKDDDVLDGVERECKIEPDAYISRQPRFREPVRIFDLHEVDRPGLLHRLAKALQLDFKYLRLAAKRGQGMRRIFRSDDDSKN